MRMWKLRVKIDVWSKGLDEGVRQRGRDLLTELYLRLIPRRVWLYSMLCTVAEFQKATLPPELWGDPTQGVLESLSFMNKGPAYMLARGKSAAPTLSPALPVKVKLLLMPLFWPVRSIIQPEKLGSAIYYASLNYAYLQGLEGVDLWTRTSWIFWKHELRRVVFLQGTFLSNY